MAGTNYDAKEGDTIPSIALQHGFYKAETIWDDPDNAALKAKRKDMNILHPGDVVVIPEIKPKKEDIATEKHHIFKLPAMTQKLRIKVEMDRGKPIASKPYLLTLDGKEYKGNTTGDGMVEQDVPVNAQKGTLKVEGIEWPIEVGHLNPVDEETADQNITGAQGRLNNMGYDCGDEKGTIGPKTESALKAFQANEGLEQSGKLDDATKKKLKERHGS